MPFIWNTILDALFPPSPREARVRTFQPHDFMIEPTIKQVGQIPITSLLQHKESSTYDLIWALKYRGSPHAARLGARIMADVLFEELSDGVLFMNAHPVVVPVPLGPRRMRERGYNQAHRLAVELASLVPGLCVRNDLLVRSRETRPQTELARTARLKNVRGAFSLKKDADIAKTSVLLIDDVTTTGATLIEAARPLQQAGAQVEAFALARA